MLFSAVSGPGVAVTPKTLPFVEAYQKKYGNVPSYAGFTTYDEVYYIAEAIHRAGTTDSDRAGDGAGGRPIMSARSAASSSCPRAIRMSMG